MEKHQAYERVLIADANILFLAYVKYKTPQIKTVLEGFNKAKRMDLLPHTIIFKPEYFC